MTIQTRETNAPVLQLNDLIGELKTIDRPGSRVDCLHCQYSTCNALLACRKQST